MIIDPKNELTFPSAIISPKSQTNNTGGGGLDIQAGNYKGKIAVVVAIGTKSTGDADGAIGIRLATSSTNNISNAVNYGSSTVNTSNNASNLGVLSVDTRDCLRYLFAIPTVSGTNSPAYPISVVALGTQEVQPAQ